MSGAEQQRAILSSEFYWFGGQLGSPKVYDPGSSFHAAPTLRGVSDRLAEDEVPESERRVVFHSDHGKWSVEIDEA